MDASDHHSGLLADEDARDPSAIRELTLSVDEIRDRLRLDPRLRLDDQDEAREKHEDEHWEPLFAGDTAAIDDRLLPTNPGELRQAASWSVLTTGGAAKAEKGSDDPVAPAELDAALATADGAAEAGAAQPVGEEAARHNLDFRVAKKLSPSKPAETVVVLGHALEKGNFHALVALAVSLLALVIGLSVGLTLPGPPMREHFIAIDETEWDYAPSGNDTCHDAPFNYKSAKMMSQSSTRIGRKYTKARFVEYTDATFTTKKPIDPRWAHLGMLGPLLRAEVGDIMRVTLRNNARFSFSLHAEGAYGDKRSEGAGYNDGSPWFKKKDDALEPYGLGVRTCEKKPFMQGRRLGVLTAVADKAPWMPSAVQREGSPLAHPDEDSCRLYDVLPGNNRVYQWPILEADGPGPAEGSSSLWRYQSHVGGQATEVHTGGLGASNTNAGLMGPIIITKKGAAVDSALKDAAGKLDPTGLRPKDVDREFVSFFTVTDENASPYLQDNIFKYAVQPAFKPLKPGWVAFGTLDRARVLQQLYKLASKGVDKLSYVDAQAAITAAAAVKTAVQEVHGFKLRVWFTESSFNPEKFDGLYGLDAAQNAVDEQKHDLVDYHDPHFIESNMMHSINGYTHCNLEGMEMTTGENVRWYTNSFGNTGDLHSPHWHGNTGEIVGGDGPVGGRVDSFELIPGGVKVMDMKPNDAGKWLYHCHINDHITAGMNAFYEVKDKEGATPTTSANIATKLGLTVPAVVREYFVAAEEVDWHYANASGSLAVDQCSGHALSALRSRTTIKTADRIGTTYRKARYIRYTDNTFETAWVSGTEQEHLGILGPILRAEVGDTIKVVFKNKSPTESFSMHPHGVFYLKAHEGAPYDDGAPVDTDDVVGPGGTHTYR
jgi:FtsP/CotA-like multicopper oxidase with cupredoxin domain